MAQRERRASKIPNRGEFLSLDDFESLDDTMPATDDNSITDSQSAEATDGGKGRGRGKLNWGPLDLWRDSFNGQNGIREVEHNRRQFFMYYYKTDQNESMEGYLGGCERVCIV